MRRFAVLLVVAALWVPSLRFFFRRSPEALVAPLTAQLLTADRAPLRRSNPEWDLMARTFTVLALLNEAERAPERREELLAEADRTLVDTLAMDQAAQDAFVLPYFHRAPFEDPRTKSLFVDGELALMLAARQLVAEVPRYRAPLASRIDRLSAAMARGPLVSA